MDLGQYNTLRAARYTSVGLFQEDGNGEAVLLPMKWVPENVHEGDDVDVFVYLDNEQRPIATTLKPKATVGDFAFLPVRQATRFGAFLDWGLEKDLLVPFDEQQERLQAGHAYVVYVYLDEASQRIVASSKIEKFTEKKDIELEEGQQVDLLIAGQTPMGYKVIINNRYLGLVYENEIFRKIKTGDRTIGFVKQLREDGKIDIVLDKPGYEKIEPNAQKILEKLKGHDGFLPLNDKSDPQLISDQLEMSKKTFKKAIGGLYRQKLITIEEDGIRLT